MIATLHGKIAISNGSPGSGGWIQFPGGAFTADPKSSVSLPGATWGYGLSWNAAMKAWVPVSWYLIRVDGQLYAYPLWTEAGQSVQIVRLNGTTAQLGTLPNTGYGYMPLGAEPEGVYVAGQSVPGGLWLLDYSGGVHVVNASGYWQMAAFGYAYGTVTQSVPQGATNVILRMNLKTKQVTQWFTRPGMQSRVVGTTLSGTPIIESSSQTTSEVWLGSQEPKLLHAATLKPASGQQPNPMFVYSALGDQVGIWVATTDGLYLYTDKAGWEFASATTGMLGSTIQ